MRDATATATITVGILAVFAIAGLVIYGVEHHIGVTFNVPKPGPPPGGNPGEEERGQD
jgi:hypothetical protein